MLTPLDDLPTWRAESGASVPRRVVAADDTMSADTAHRLACEGTGLLWQGDFHNARQLLQALARRTERKPKRNPALAADITPLQAFNAHRLAFSQRARLLAMVIVPLEGDYTIPLRRSPDLKQACTDAWGAATGQACMVSLRELLGVVGAHEWRKKGVEIAALGDAPHNRIHPHYGVFSPVRGEYVDLVAQVPLPPAALVHGAAVACISPAGRMIERIAIPARHPTMVAFGGPALDSLYVTSATALLNGEERARWPLAGALFQIDGLGARGVPEPMFANP
jgi:hypothetical protein